MNALETKPSRFGWLSHVPPVISTLLALAMLILTPVWAVDYYRQPFVGVLLEPNNIVSKIVGKNWPASQAGAVWPEQLVKLGDTPVKDVQQVKAYLAGNGDAPLWMEFIQRTGTARDVLVTPVQMTLGDFISLFVIPYLVGLVFLGLGLWAYFLRGGLRASRALLIFASAVSVTTSTFFDMNTTHHVVLLWAVSLSVAASACIHLALVFPQQVRMVNRWPATRFIAWVIGLGFVIPVISEILAPSSPLAYIPTWQYSYAYMALAIGLFLGLLTWRILHSDSPIVRQQSRVIIFGAALAFAPVMIFYLLPTAFSNSPQEFYASVYFPLLIIFPLSITYAILRYRLLDVDRLLAKVMTYVVTTTVALLVFYGLITALSLLIRQSIHPDNPLLIALYLLALVLGLSPLLRFVQRSIDRFFYRAPADYRRVLNVLSSKLVITPDLERTLQLLSDQLQQALAPEKFVIYLYDDQREAYLPHSSAGIAAPSITALDPLVAAIRSAVAPLSFLSYDVSPEALRQSEIFRELGCSAFVPLNYEGNLIGFMALGPRLSGDPYSSDDLDFLSTVAGESALALENARLFINLRHTLDQTLEMKNLMDDIFASIATGVITTDVGHKITLFNRAAENILGIQVKDVLGKSLPEALPQCPDLETAAAEALDCGTATLSQDVARNMPPRGDLYLRLSCSPLRDAYLATKGATIVFEDLTERHKLEAEQERIRRTFGRVVAPRVRDRLLSDPSHLRLDGTYQQITLLFADISGFTSFSEKVVPEELFKTLNYYLSLAAQTIFEEEGTLDKFMGDAILALWNAPDPQPDHALRAVRAALAIQERARQAYQPLQGPSYALQFHIAVATGEAMVGNLGTAELFNYTAVGDTVNLCQRLEAVAQPGQVLIDQATYSALADRLIADSLEPVLLKGKAQPVPVYNLKGLQ
ncbi:MAG TPA: adenylate/guanylate cyclase domain-containing protein [Anaerolineales bacterium]|nr:adenylate/guanylate cyclase domain-containing protein [Anaerolineales bacterium]